jgi:hypothetical protein
MIAGIVGCDALVVGGLGLVVGADPPSSAATSETLASAPPPCEAPELPVDAPDAEVTGVVPDELPLPDLAGAMSPPPSAPADGVSPYGVSGPVLVVHAATAIAPIPT